MNQNGGRDVRTSATGLVQPEHLEAAGGREEEYRRRKENTDVIVRCAQGFEVRRGYHFGCRAHGKSGYRPLRDCLPQNTFESRIRLTDV